MSASKTHSGVQESVRMMFRELSSLTIQQAGSATTWRRPRAGQTRVKQDFFQLNSVHDDHDLLLLRITARQERV
jgi:hypothetical protein